jgi:hypothetical protein
LPGARDAWNRNALAGDTAEAAAPGHGWLWVIGL